MKSTFLSTAFLASVGYCFVGCANEGGSPLLGMATGGFTQTNNTGGTSTTQNGQGGNSTQTGGQQNQNQGGSSTGGSVANTGGANTGGANTGGSSTGGASTGGKSAGGSSTGGAATGGKSAGGSSTGGAATGGKSAGGSATGGAATGGKAAGGSSTGGAGIGGASTGGATTATGGATTATGGASTGTCANFSFFVTSMAAMVKLSASSKGFGGDLRYGQADGLAGADKICSTIAATALPCAANKTWKAFLCTATVDGIDRVGTGPWYDRNGAKVWSTLSEMTSADRPPSSYVNRDDLPNEDGIPNHDYDLDGNVNDDDNHDFLTGCGTNGRKIAADTTAKRCNEWTSTTVSVGSSTGGGIGMMMNGPMCGHSWPRQGSGTNWVSSIREGGCGAGINLAETGGATEATVGSGGGYGGIYCFATTP